MWALNPVLFWVVLLGLSVPEMLVRDSTQMLLPPWYLTIAWAEEIAPAWQKYKPDKSLIRSWETLPTCIKCDIRLFLEYQKMLPLFHRNEGVRFQQMAITSHLHVNSRINRSFLPWMGYRQKCFVQVTEQSKPLSGEQCVEFSVCRYMLGGGKPWMMWHFWTSCALGCRFGRWCSVVW